MLKKIRDATLLGEGTYAKGKSLERYAIFFFPLSLSLPHSLPLYCSSNSHSLTSSVYSVQVGQSRVAVKHMKVPLESIHHLSFLDEVKTLLHLGTAHSPYLVQLLAILQEAPGHLFLCFEPMDASLSAWLRDKYAQQEVVDKAEVVGYGLDCVLTCVLV